MNEAVILAGGRGLRLKGHVEVPKPFVIVNSKTGETLLDSQVTWLLSHGFEHLILALSRENFKYLRVNYGKYLNIPAIDFSIEEEHLGTGGGLKKALELVEEKNFYCCNVDDVVFLDPNELLLAQDNKNVILVKRAKLPFGVVEFDKDMFVTSFKEKPVINKFVSCGHYAFNKNDISDLLPDEGDLEVTLLHELARLRKLKAYILTGKWMPINDYKQLMEARGELERTVNDNKENK